MKSISEQSLNQEMMTDMRLAEMGGMEASAEDPAASQAAYGEAQHFEYTTSLSQKIFALVVNLLVLGELTIAMYFASKTPESMTPVFFKIFFGLLLPTLVGAIFVKRFINARTVK